MRLIQEDVKVCCASLAEVLLLGPWILIRHQQLIITDILVKTKGVVLLWETYI
jgi:hypothetical protein